MERFRVYNGCLFCFAIFFFFLGGGGAGAGGARRGFGLGLILELGPRVGPYPLFLGLGSLLSTLKPNRAPFCSLATPWSREGMRLGEDMGVVGGWAVT